jgi:hypothetical protein
MKLTKITARNFKGQSFTLTLTPITFLVGSNFAGKTARTDAIRLLLIGYLPELGKTHGATWGLSSGREMVIEGEFDNGQTIRRRWFLKGDSVKYESDVAGLEAILGIECEPQLAVMLNAEVYFALGPTDRVRYVFDNIGALPNEDAYIKDATGKLATIATEAGDIVTGKIEELFPNIESESAQDWVAKMIEHVATKAKDAKDFAARMEKTAQGLAYLRTQDVTTENPSALEQARAELVAEIDRLTGEKVKFQAAYDQARKNKQRRDELALAVRAKGKLTERKTNLSLSIDSKDHERENIPATTPEEIESLRSQERDSAMALRDHERDLRDVDAGIERCKKEFSEVSGRDCCPYCKAKGEGWKTVKVDEITSAIDGLDAKRAVLVDHIAKVRASNIDLVARFNGARDANAQRTALDVEINALRRDLDGIEKDLAVLGGKEDELAHLPSDDTTAIAAVETAQTAINIANDKLRDIDRKKTAAAGRANDLKRLSEAETERDAAKVEESVAKKAVDVLKATQRKMVEDAFVPLLKAANSFFPTVLKTAIAYNADNGELGTWRDGVWVGHRTFSGTEKALTYAAIQAALAAKSPVRIMLLDELGRLDESNTEKLLLAVGAAIQAKRIDQFIGISTVRPSDLIEDCKVEMVG